MNFTYHNQNQCEKISHFYIKYPNSINNGYKTRGQQPFSIQAISKYLGLFETCDFYHKY